MYSQLTCDSDDHDDGAGRADDHHGRAVDVEYVASAAD